MRHTIVLLLCIFSVAQTDSRIPPEVLHKSGYVNPVPKPTDFTSAMLWGIAIADTRIQGYKKARIEISRMQLTGRVDGRDFALNDDRGQLRGGLYRRYPWFGNDPALLQVGFDYWRNPTIGYESGGNNHEAGASDWYFPLDMWQEATITTLRTELPALQAAEKSSG